MSDREFVAWSIACLSCGFTGEHPVPADDGIPKVDRCRCPKCSTEAHVLHPLRLRFVITALCKQVAKLKLDFIDIGSMAEEVEEIKSALSRLTDKPAAQPDAVQAQIDAAVKAERERWEAMSQIDFANQSTARSIRNIDALIRKGDSHDR